MSYNGGGGSGRGDRYGNGHGNGDGDSNGRHGGDGGSYRPPGRARPIPTPQARDYPPRRSPPELEDRESFLKFLHTFRVVNQFNSQILCSFDIYANLSPFKRYT
jgi:hypothetical protein